MPQAAPASVGLDSTKLEALFAEVAANDPKVRGAPLIHSILVARHGKLVAERYFAGYSPERLHELRSLSKSFASLLLGAARVHGLRISGDATLSALMPQYRDLFSQEPSKGRLTLEQLLGMRSGLACDEFDESSPGNEDRMQTQTNQPDWYRFFLRLPVVKPAGTSYAYCSAGTHVAAGAIAAAAHRRALSLFDQWIAQPLRISTYSFPLDPRGRAYFGGGTHMRPRDVIKIGQLVLDHGRWAGRQIVDPDWLERSTSCPSSEPRCSEGFGWHFNTIETNGRRYREIEANGNGGQLLMIYPELDMTIVITAANYNAYPVWRKFRENLVPQYVLAGVATP
jgi:CubicO group peptidase (beta-lactamase class C family)